MKLSLLFAFAGVLSLASAYARPNPYALADAEPNAVADVDDDAGHELGFLNARDAYAHNGGITPGRPARPSNRPARPRRNQKRNARDDGREPGHRQKRSYRVYEV